MERELVKEIKELIDLDKKQNEFSGIIVVNRQFLIDVIAIINELESENAELKKYRFDWLNGEKMHLQAELEETEFELSSSNSLFEIVSKENKQLKDRIAELEKENAKLNRELDKRDCVDYPCRLIEKEHLKQFAERLKEKSDFYRNGERIVDMVTFDDIDETLKEMIEK